MSEKNLEQRVQELEQGQQMLGEEMKAISPASKEYWDGKFEELGAKLVELTNHPDEGEVEQLRNEVVQLRQSTAERFVSAFERAELNPGEDQYAQRIFDAISSKGYDIVPAGRLAEATGEAEGIPEPPYLHIIDEERWGKLSDEERKGYSPWTGGKFARLVEAV